MRGISGQLDYRTENRKSIEKFITDYFRLPIRRRYLNPLTKTDFTKNRFYQKPRLFDLLFYKAISIKPINRPYTTD